MDKRQIRDGIFWMGAVDWDRRFAAEDNARILLDYDQTAFEARVRAALAASWAGLPGL